MMFLNQGADYFWIIVLVIFVTLLLIPLLLSIIGLAIRKKRPKTAKILFICAVTYLVIGLGVCGIGYAI